MHFGSSLRLLRVDAGFSVRELARRIGVSGAYLSRVENGYDAPPTPDRLIAVAEVLGVSPSALLEIARQTGPAVEAYLQRVPAAGSLFLEVARRDLNTADVARVKAFLDREFPAPRRARPASLVSRLSPDRVVTGFIGSTLRDLAEVAATRLTDVRGPSAHDLVEAVLRREDEASSCVGGGFVMPHAIVPGSADVAVLVTMARPLPIESPDGEPVRVGVVVISSAAGERHLDTLGRVARLASYDIAAELCAASPTEVRAILERVESLW
jgi:nitrogen PTS system EIIA component